MLRTLRTVSGPQGPRVILEGRDVLLLCSNNYLGLANHPALQAAACEAVSRFGAGTGASRLISGSMEPHVKLEERIAEFKGTGSALLFNSGYAANTGILQGLFGPDDVIFSDELNHASIIDGCRLSRARTLVYPHGDFKSLEAMMHTEAPRRRGRWVIVTDGVFSMDGDIAPLTELASLKERYDAMLMVDDAHGTGVLGDGGRGTGELLGCMDKIDLHMGTLGKALGCCGAYLAADSVVIDTLINRSRSFIFSTSLSPVVPAMAMAAIDIVDSAEGAVLRKELARKQHLFASLLQQGGMDLCGSRTQIVPVWTGEPEITMSIAARLLEQGIFIQGIRPPTVPKGRCRLRGTLMADHADADLTRAAEAILTAVREAV